jgi:NADPH-dependent glutamate synthase beta subunit-like oxidoreductase
LGIPNEDAPGVLDAIEFLKRINLNQSVPVGSRIGVIGGGNAAVDAARVALRLSTTQSVQVIYRRTRAEMPAFAEEIDALVEEGAELQLLTAPVEVLTQHGRLAALRCIRMELGEPDDSGRRRPVPIPGSEFDIPLDTLLVAIGEDPEVQFLGTDSGIEVSRRGIALVAKETQATGRAGVFAGGDVVTGPDTVVAAMAAGKVAAEMIDKYLRHQPVDRHYEPVRPSKYVPPRLRHCRAKCPPTATTIPLLPVTARHSGFAEVELTLTEEQAVHEASRCLRCDLQTEDAKRQLVEMT